MPDAETVLRELSLLLGADQISSEKHDLEHYGSDWTRFHAPCPLAVVFPRKVEEVVAIVQLANRLEIGLVPSGGRTGLSGGAVALAGELVVSFDRLNQVLAFDPVDRTLLCQAGVVTRQVQEFAQNQGLLYPVDFASAGSSQLGGNVATNAGGIKVLRYGLTRAWVAGLKVVTGRGDLLELNRGLVKNATGYDLRHLFIGSEGTLGFVVEVLVQLTAAPRSLRVMLLQVPDLASIMAVLQAFQARLCVTAFEFFSELALGHVLSQGSLRPPFAAPSAYYVLLEYEETGDSEAQALAEFEHCLETGLVTDGVLSQSQTEAASLWRYREQISEAITHRTPWKNDISVRVSRVPAFLAAIDLLVAEHYPDFELVWFGHIGDGNLHLNILKPPALSIEEFRQRCERVNDEVYGKVREFEGSISAEHGIGLLKKPFLHFSRSEVELAYLRGIKQLFDPKGVMNPGKLL